MNEPFASDASIFHLYGLGSQAAKYCKHESCLYGQTVESDDAIRQVDVYKFVYFYGYLGPVQNRIRQYPGRWDEQDSVIISLLLAISTLAPTRVNNARTEASLQARSCGLLMSEFHIHLGKNGNNGRLLNRLKAADANLPSWARWVYKPYHPITGAGESLIAARLEMFARMLLNCFLGLGHMLFSENLQRMI